MTNRRRIAGATAVLLLAACSSGSTSPSLTISPTSANVTAGGAAVPFTATLANATGTISWVLTGPGTISDMSGPVTSYTPPVSVASATTATLTANAGSGLTAPATINISPPPSITVAGTVLSVSESFSGISAGVPQAGVAVLIGSKSAVTDASGNFTIPNVVPPYNLITVVSTPRKVAIEYVGLTRADPKVISVTASGSLANAGMVTGNVTGGDALNTAGDSTVVAFGSPETTGAQSITANPYTINLHWNGPSSTTGNLHALQRSTDASGTTTGYPGYALATGVAVANGGTTNAAALAMTAPTTAMVGGAITVPSGFTLLGSVVFLSFADHVLMDVGSTSTATSFSYLVPNNISATAGIEAVATVTGVSESVAFEFGIAPGTTNVSVPVLAGAQAVLPANAGTGITTTTPFSWTPFAGGVHLLVVDSGLATIPSFYVITAGSQATIPDLTAQGLGLPSATAYTWSVIGTAPFASTDAFAASNGLFATGNTIDYSVMLTSRSFTTQ